MMLRLLAWLKYADERLQFTLVCVPMMSRKRGCVTITWALFVD